MAGFSWNELSGSQKKIAKQIVGVGKKRGSSRKQLLASLVTAIQESGIANLKIGDQDSSGWRQERAQYYPAWNESVKDDARRFFKDLGGATGGIGEMAQSAQRSAYPDAYDDDIPDAKDILAHVGGSTKGGGGKAVRSAKGGSQGKVTSKPTGMSARDKLALQQAALSFIQTEDKTLSDYMGIASAREAAETTAATPTYKGTPGTAPSKAAKKGGGKAKATGKSSASIVSIGKMAQDMGLNVGENPKFGGVAPVHTEGSYHYTGDAIDVSGDVTAMKRFAKKVAKKYGKNVAELFWNGPGATNIDNGQKVEKGFVSGHTDHVHVAVPR